MCPGQEKSIGKESEREREEGLLAAEVVSGGMRPFAHAALTVPTGWCKKNLFLIRVIPK